MNVSLVGFRAQIGLSIPAPRHLDSLTGRATVRSVNERLAIIRRRLIWVLAAGTAALLVNAVAIAQGWYAFL